MSREASPSRADRERARAIVLRHGRETVVFQGLGEEFRFWFDPGREACVAYVDTGREWVAAGGPTCADEHRAAVAEEFVRSARASGRSASFFCVDQASALCPGFAALRLGEHAEFDPRNWPRTLARHRRLREQLRRSRAKGVRVRRVDPAELVEGAALRAAVDALTTEWLGGHHLEPMHFLVTVAPYGLATDRRYYVAELAGRVIAFTWLAPIPARRGWLVEHSVRGSGRGAAPNGTTELLLDAVIRDAREDGVVSIGLAPLTGPIAWPLRAVRALTSPLYDFRSLRSFKQRLHPDRWQTAWLVHPRRRGVRAVLASLRAFAGGSLLGFGLRSLFRHPSGLPWLLAVPLVPWTILLAVLLTGDGALLGFSRPMLTMWVGWDAVLAWLLFRTARHPRRDRLVALAGAAATDAVLSLVHLHRVGLGHSIGAAGLRLAATIAPLLGTLALAWAASCAAGRGGERRIGALR